MTMLHEVDPAQKLMGEVKPWLENVDLPFSQVLLGVYLRPAKTASGIHLPDQTREEDEYQGKAALVLKIGPMAYRDNEELGVRFEGFKVNVGDWVMIRASDGWPVKIGKTLCRIISDVDVRMVIPEPDLVW